MKILLAIALVLLWAIPVLADERRVISFHDAFTKGDLAERRAVRGPWQIGDGVARCTQDDELYRQHKDHGPIIFYDLSFDDGIIRFSYRPEECRTVVFTANGDEGHIFRFVTNEQGTMLRAFPKDAATKSIPLAQNGPKLPPGAWTEVSVELRGERATVRIGDDYTTTVEHPSLARAKTNISVGFSFGTLAVKPVSVQP